MQTFSSFNRQFPLTKTLKFELIPHPKTKQQINWNTDTIAKIFPEERKRAVARKKIKSYWDELIFGFIFVLSI